MADEQPREYSLAEKEEWFMRKRRRAEDGGFNVWRSYSDMMAGVLLGRQGHDVTILEKNDKPGKKLFITG